MKKTVSIAMATYNGGRYLREQLESLYNQTYQPFEIVVCDDNSKDDTHSILEEYHQKKGLRYYINNPNLGVNRNFYKAISLCKGEYIMICDQDDIWLPNKIEETLKHMIDIDDGQPSLVSSLCQNIDSKGEIMGTLLPDKPDTCGYKYIFVTDSSAQGCSLMLNKALVSYTYEFINNESAAQKVMYDYFIGMVAALYGNSYQCGKRLMSYRHHDGNVVAKAQGARSLMSKVKESNGLVHFQNKSIFNGCSIGCVVFNRGDEKPEAKALMHKIASLGATHNYFKQMFILFSIKEIAFKRKLKIAGENLLVNIFRPF